MGPITLSVTFNWHESLAREKYSSLVGLFIGYKEKKFDECDSKDHIHIFLFSS